MGRLNIFGKCTIPFCYEIDSSRKGGCFQGFGVLPGFWSCSKGFAVKCENLSEFYEKSFKKGTENWKKGSPLYYYLC